MRNYLRTLEMVLVVGTMFLGMSAVVGAQQAPPASQQPMEIPAPNPPQPQAGPQQGGPQDPGAARISFIHGDVSTQHNGSSDWDAATINTPVVNGDHISTGQNARAEIQLDHANVLRLSDQTTANVVNLAPNEMQLQIGQGLASYEDFRNNDANVEIDTPNVAIHPDAGEGSYRILVNSDGETIVDVRKGAAEISTPQGSTHVQRDQRITIQGNADNAQYQISGAPGGDDWDRWNSDRDRMIEGAQSWQHTNPYYTGTQDLDTNGQWTNVPDYGSVWFPDEGPGWAPYRDGRWVYEPYYGWTWVSYEPWGWAPYHYGRWFVYGGNWGWWPGPVYAGYRPLWAPAYVSFFGFGGGGWGVGLGFGFGGFGSVGWLPCGPGDRFFPWYGRGINRVNVVNIADIHNAHGGIGPLRDGPRAYSNFDRAFSDERVRGGISSMRSSDFGDRRVPMQQSRMDAGTFRQASMLTGAHPVSPTRESFQSTNRAVNPGSAPNRAAGSQRFFSSSARQSTFFQAGRSGNANTSRGEQYGEAQRGVASSSSRQGQSIQSSRPGWRTFTPPASSQMRSARNGTIMGQGTPQSRSTYSQSSEPSRQYQDNSRGGYYRGGTSRPTLNMQQPVVTPRGNNSYAGRAPSGGGYGGSRGGPSEAAPYSGRSMSSAPAGRGYQASRGVPSGGSFSSRPMSSAPSGRSYGGGGYRSGSSGGGSHGGSSHGGSSGGGHGHR